MYMTQTRKLNWSLSRFNAMPKITLKHILSTAVKMHSGKNAISLYERPTLDWHAYHQHSTSEADIPRAAAKVFKDGGLDVERVDFMSYADAADIIREVCDKNKDISHELLFFTALYPVMLKLDSFFISSDTYAMLHTLEPDLSFAVKSLQNAYSSYLEYLDDHNIKIENEVELGIIQDQFRNYMALRDVAFDCKFDYSNTAYTLDWLNLQLGDDSSDLRCQLTSRYNFESMLAEQKLILDTDLFPNVSHSSHNLALLINKYSSYNTAAKQILVTKVVTSILKSSSAEGITLAQGQNPHDIVNTKLDKARLFYSQVADQEFKLILDKLSMLIQIGVTDVDTLTNALLLENDNCAKPALTIEHN